MKVSFDPVEFNKSVREAKRLAKAAKNEAQNLTNGSEILAEQNRAILEKAENYVRPLQEKFNCTKSMLRYSTARCVQALKEGMIEHAVVFNLKENRVIGEFLGDTSKCNLTNLEKLILDKENIGIMHSHPNGYPISRPDITTMRKLGINQVIAINSDGEFSLVAKRYKEPVKGNKLQKWFKEKNEAKKENKAYHQYASNSIEDAQVNSELLSEEFKAGLVDDTLKTYAPNMGMRYITNYSSLKK